MSEKLDSTVIVTNRDSLDKLLVLYTANPPFQLRLKNANYSTEVRYFITHLVICQ